MTIPSEALKERERVETEKIGMNKKTSPKSE